MKFVATALFALILPTESFGFCSLVSDKFYENNILQDIARSLLIGSDLETFANTKLVIDDSTGRGARATNDGTIFLPKEHLTDICYKALTGMARDIALDWREIEYPLEESLSQCMSNASATKCLEEYHSQLRPMLDQFVTVVFNQDYDLYQEINDDTISIYALVALHEFGHIRLDHHARIQGQNISRLQAEVEADIFALSRFLSSSSFPNGWIYWFREINRIHKISGLQFTSDYDSAYCRMLAGVYFYQMSDDFLKVRARHLQTSSLVALNRSEIIVNLDANEIALEFEHRCLASRQINLSEHRDRAMKLVDKYEALLNDAISIEDFSSALPSDNILDATPISIFGAAFEDYVDNARSQDSVNMRGLEDDAIKFAKDLPVDILSEIFMSIGSWAFIDNQDHDEAIQYFGKSVEINPNNTDALALRGLVSLNRGGLTELECRMAIDDISHFVGDLGGTDVAEVHAKAVASFEEFGRCPEYRLELTYGDVHRRDVAGGGHQVSR